MKRILTIISAFAVAGCGGKDAGEPSVQDDAASASPVAVEVAGGNPAAEQAALEITDPYMREIIAEISDDSY